MVRPRPGWAQLWWTELERAGRRLRSCSPARRPSTGCPGCSSRRPRRRCVACHPRFRSMSKTACRDRASSTSTRLSSSDVSGSSSTSRHSAPHVGSRCAPRCRVRSTAEAVSCPTTGPDRARCEAKGRRERARPGAALGQGLGGARLQCSGRESDGYEHSLGCGAGWRGVVGRISGGRRPLVVQVDAQPPHLLRWIGAALTGLGTVFGVLLVVYEQLGWPRAHAFAGGVIAAMVLAGATGLAKRSRSTLPAPRPTPSSSPAWSGSWPFR